MENKWSRPVNKKTRRLGLRREGEKVDEVAAGRTGRMET